MRIQLALVPLLMVSSTALAQAPTAPPQLTDPKIADRLSDAMQALSQALLNLPVGEVRAAVEGRDPTAADRKLTVGDLGRRDNPEFDRDLRQQIAQARPAIEHGMKAFNTALPAMMKALDEASRAIDRAAANMPDPTYPRR